MFASFFDSWWKSDFTERHQSNDVMVLHPSHDATEVVAGFRGGKDLRMQVVATGETIGQVLSRLNIYRGPDQVLKRVWNPDTGTEFSANTVIKGILHVEVRPDSI